MFAGQLGCEAVNFALKRWIKEERPRRVHLMAGKGYGMPSSHAQFVFFWAVALGLFLVVRHRARGGHVRRDERRKTGQVHVGPAEMRMASSLAPGRGEDLLENHASHEPLSVAHRMIVSAAALGLASAVAWSRVYLGYHTPKQVLVGCAAGALSAAAWFLATALMRQTGLLALVLGTPLARWMRLRDLAVEEDVCQAGWEKWELVSRARINEKSK
jgi:dolichyldiphosphatase